MIYLGQIVFFFQRIIHKSLILNKLFRGMYVNPLLLLHGLMKISKVIHEKINAIFQLHSGNNNLEK